MIKAPSPEKRLSAEELDVLQEVINISFGRATAELAEVVDIYVVLSVPHIRVFSTGERLDFLKAETGGCRSVSVLEQRYWGRFNGVALLVFPGQAGRELVSMLNDQGDWLQDDADPELLEKETLIEVGNIIIGACVGKVAELLSDVVTYSPPRVVVGSAIEEALGLPGSDAFSIVMKTVFSFKERDVNGMLLLLSSADSLGWLKMALNQFMGQYE